MKRALIIIACNYRGNPAVRELNVGRDVVGLGGFFEHVAGYDIVEIVQDVNGDMVLAELAKVVSRLSPGDLLLIYYGGHGIQGAEHLLVLPRGPRDPQNAACGFLPVAELRRQTEGRGLVRALVLDCCRNGDANAEPVTTAAAVYTRDARVSTPASRDVGFGRAAVAGGEKGSFAILCACSDDEVAPELADTGKGLFSTALQNVLKQAHRTGWRIRIDDDLRDKVEAEMQRLAKDHNVAFTPQPWKAGNGTPMILEGNLRPLESIRCDVVAPDLLISEVMIDPSQKVIVGTARSFKQFTPTRYNLKCLIFDKRDYCVEVRDLVVYVNGRNPKQFSVGFGTEAKEIVRLRIEKS